MNNDEASVFPAEKWRCWAPEGAKETFDYRYFGFCLFMFLFLNLILMDNGSNIGCDKKKHFNS